LTDYMTEQEQIQQLKTWLKTYGLTILAGVALALTTTTGWHYWQNYRDKVLTHASLVYDEMLSLRAQGNANGSLVQAEKILTHYSRTPYAQMAALIQARDAVLKKNYPEALAKLNWVVAHSKDQSMRQIARLRVARIYINDNKPQEALASLNQVEDKNFSGLINEIKGDAYLAMNNPVEARNTYKLALEELPNADATRPLLQMKYDNLA
jgi:predicted negative regulator of RcsB-dependent stress response